MNPKRIAYFVGAGLSKALEKPGKRIPLMCDFVRVMAELSDSDDTILTSLAELENAKAFQYECDDCARLARRVVGSQADRSCATKLAFKKAFMSRRPESIEQLLANALAKGPGEDGPSGTALVIRLNYAINRFFSLLGWEVDGEPLLRFLRHQFTLHPPLSNHHTFVAFNYDLILDHAIQATAGDNWNPFTGYGFSVRHYWECAKDRVAGLPAQSEPPPSDRIRILKPHGSLNWLVPQAKSAQTDDIGYALEDGPVCIPLSQEGEVTYSHLIAPKAVFPTILAVCIIPLTHPAKDASYRFSFIDKTRCKERTAIEKADEVYVLGWSMPATDRDQDRLIRSSVAERTKPVNSVTVINQCEKPEYFDRIAAAFGAPRSNLRIFNDGFSNYVQDLSR